MQLLHLQYDEVMNGTFTTQKVNLLFTFQVNCPGCFAYGFPLVSSIKNKFKEDIGYLGLSTAFEDFELNTAKNTQRLVNSGAVVGETQKMFTSQGIDQYSGSIDFPIAMDHIIKEQELENNIFVDKICRINPDFDSWSTLNKELLRQKVRDYLRQQSKISFTFTANQFRGTPTFIIFNDKMEILHHWFGHITPTQVEDSLTAALKAYGLSI